MLGRDEYIGNLLAVLVSLRLIALKDDDPYPTGDVPALITNATARAPHLEYFAMYDRYWKRIDGEWVICDETGFPSLVLESVLFD